MRLVLAALLAVGVAAAAARPPKKLVFPSREGAVAFDHAAHLKRAGGRCAACHDKPWARSARVPVDSKDCRICHQPGGAAFEMKGNCGRCHEEKTAAARP